MNNDTKTIYNALERTPFFPYFKFTNKAYWFLAILLLVVFAYFTTKLAYPSDEVKHMIDASTAFLEANPEAKTYFGTISKTKLIGYSINSLMHWPNRQHKPGYAQIELNILGEKAEKHITFTFKKIENNWVLDSSDFSE